MKNQYFGDVNDFRKYGLLRAITRAAQLRLSVVWMLTPDDGSADGKFTAYLEKPDAWRAHDPELFDGMRALMKSEAPRSVSLIEHTGLLPGAAYHSTVVPESAPDRDRWFQQVRAEMAGSNLVFFDPDNGIEIKSLPYGRRKSSKFVYWREIEEVWNAGSSMLIYQHFIREKRERFVGRMLAALRERAAGSFVEAFSTAHVVFLLALQPRHQHYHEPIVSTVRDRWGDQIVHWSLADVQQIATADAGTATRSRRG